MTVHVHVTVLSICTCHPTDIVDISEFCGVFSIRAVRMGRTCVQAQWPCSSAKNPGMLAVLSGNRDDKTTTCYTPFGHTDALLLLKLSHVDVHTENAQSSVCVVATIVLTNAYRGQGGSGCALRISRVCVVESTVAILILHYATPPISSHGFFSYYVSFLNPY
jgi:hypothetical protein